MRLHVRLLSRHGRASNMLMLSWLSTLTWSWRQFGNHGLVVLLPFQIPVMIRAVWSMTIWSQLVWNVFLVIGKFYYQDWWPKTHTCRMEWWRVWSLANPSRWEMQVVNLTSPRLLESQKRKKRASLKWLLVSIRFDVICVSCVCIYIYINMHIYTYIGVLFE